MNPLRRHRHLFARLAAVVLLLAALAPGVSRALAFAQGSIAPWSVLCSGAMAMSMASPGADDNGSSELNRHLLEHCTLCHLAGDAPPPPPAQAPVAGPLALGRDGLPPLALRAPRPLHAWAAPPAQGPPAAA